MRMCPLVLAMLVAAAPALAQSRRDYTVEIPGERSKNNIITLAAVAGAGAVLGGLGVYYNLDSRDAANSVSAGKFTNQPWDASRQDAFDRAHESGVKAAVFYGVGGALLVGAAIAFIVTEPKSEKMVIRPHAAPTVAPAPGGAILGGTWSF